MPARDLPPELRQAARAARSLQEFEARVTAPRFGYPSYGVFCEVNRPAAVLPRIRVPTLVMLAADDPLVPLGSMEGIDWQDCPAVLPLPVAGGGHCGFYDWRAESAVGAGDRRVLRGRGGGAGEPHRRPQRGRLTIRTQAAASAPSLPGRARHRPGSRRR